MRRVAAAALLAATLAVAPPALAGALDAARALSAATSAAARAQVIELLRKTATGENCVVVACHDRELIELEGARRWHLEGGRIAAD